MYFQRPETHHKVTFTRKTLEIVERFDCKTFKSSKRRKFDQISEMLEKHLKQLEALKLAKRRPEVSQESSQAAAYRNTMK